MSALRPRPLAAEPLIVGGVLGEAIEVKGSSQVTIADLGAVDLAATFNNLVYATTLVAGNRVLVQFAASPGGGHPQSTHHCGLYIVGPIAAGIAPLTRDPIRYDNGSLVYDSGDGPTKYRGWNLSCAEPLVLDTTAQDWIAQPATSWFSSWAFFSTGEWTAPTKADHDRDWFVVSAGQESHWKCVRTATNTYQWIVLWSAWYGATGSKPAASVAYDGLRYYDTTLARLELCTRTGAATWAWCPLSGGASVPVLVDQLNFIGAHTDSTWTQVVAAGRSYDVRVTVETGDTAGNVGVFFTQALVRRTAAGNVTLIDGPNVVGPNFLDAALAGSLATIDVNVGTQEVRSRFTSVLVGTQATRTLVQSIPLVLP